MAMGHVLGLPLGVRKDSSVLQLSMTVVFEKKTRNFNSGLKSAPTIHTKINDIRVSSIGLRQKLIVSTQCFGVQILVREVMSLRRCAAKRTGAANPLKSLRSDDANGHNTTYLSSKQQWSVLVSNAC
jgi:hypothetical protein